MKRPPARNEKGWKLSFRGGVHLTVELAGSRVFLRLCGPRGSTRRERAIPGPLLIGGETALRPPSHSPMIFTRTRFRLLPSNSP